MIENVAWRPEAVGGITAMPPQQICEHPKLKRRPGAVFHDSGQDRNTAGFGHRIKHGLRSAMVSARGSRTAERNQTIDTLGKQEPYEPARRCL